MIKRQFGFQKTRLRGMLKNGCKVHVLAALANLFMARHELLVSEGIVCLLRAITACNGRDFTQNGAISSQNHSRPGL